MCSQRSRIVGVLLPLLGFAFDLAAPTDARAQTTFNNSTGNGLWSDPLNWTNGVPDANDTATIGVAATISLPTAPPAEARLVQRGFSVSNPIVLSGGRLMTKQISAFGGIAPFMVSSDIASPADALVLQSVVSSGTIGDFSGGGSFDLILSRSSLRGATTTAGQVTLFSSQIEEAGSLASTGGIDWLGEGSITASSSAPVVNRLPDSSPLRLYQASMLFNAEAVNATAESLGTMGLMIGRNDVHLVGPSTGSLVLTAQALTRQGGTVMQFDATPTAHLRFVNSPAGPNGAAPTDRGILGFGTGFVTDGATQRASFLTYDRGADPNNIDDDPGLRPLDWNTEYSTDLAVGGNVRLSGASVLSTPRSIRSLNLVDGSVQVNGVSLSIAEGVIMQGSSTTAFSGTGNLMFGGEANLLAFGDATTSFSIDVPIHAASLTKGGPAKVVLAQSNDVPGAISVAEGTLVSRAAGALGSGPVTLGSGTIRIEQVSQVIDDLHTFQYTKQTTFGGFSFGIAAGSISVASGLTLTINHGDGAGVVQLNGEGLVHLPAGRTLDAGVNIYSGEFRVDGQVGVSLFGSVIVNVDGGKLTGSGAIPNAIFAIDSRGGTVSPGGDSSVGDLTTGTFWFGNASPIGAQPILRLDLNGTQPIAYDQIHATNVFLNQLTLDLAVGYAAHVGDAFMVIDNSSTFGIFPIPTLLPEGSTFIDDGYLFRISYVGGDGNDVTLTVQAIVPEPATLGLLLCGALLCVRRRFIRE